MVGSCTDRDPAPPDEQVLYRETVDWGNKLLVRWVDPNLYIQFMPHQLNQLCDHWYSQGLLDDRCHVAVTSGKEASAIVERADDAFMEADDKAHISDSVLQEWRNALGALRSKR